MSAKLHNRMVNKQQLLSQVFPAELVVRDCSFSQLDEVTTQLPGSLAYCQNLYFLQLAESNINVSAIVTTPALAQECISKGLVVSDDPRLVFFEMYVQQQENGYGFPVMDFGIGENCKIHPSATISPYALIEDGVEIEANAVIEAFSHIREDAVIGPNTVIGAEGLISVSLSNGQPIRLKHMGGVEIGRGVVILAGAIVAKSLFRSFTYIGDYCQIGIMANIGHGASVGAYSVISGNTVIAGRTKLGTNVWVGASVSIAQGLVVGEKAQIKMGSVVISDVAAGQVVSGNFAVPHKANMRDYLRIRSL